MTIKTVLDKIHPSRAVAVRAVAAYLGMAESSVWGWLSRGAPAHKVALIRLETDKIKALTVEKRVRTIHYKQGDRPYCWARTKKPVLTTDQGKVTCPVCLKRMGK